MIGKYRFYKSELDNKWYIDLPEYLEFGGEQADLEMVMGADTLLDVVSNYTSEVVLKLSDSFVDNDYTELILISKDEFGAFYNIKTDYSYIVGDTIWLCSVTKFVFDNKFPDIIWFKKIS